MKGFKVTVLCTIFLAFLVVGFNPMHVAAYGVYGIKVCQLKPGERVVIRSQMTDQTKVGFADRKGEVLFKNLSIGSWSVRIGGEKSIIISTTGAGKRGLIYIGCIRPF